MMGYEYGKGNVWRLSSTSTVILVEHVVSPHHRRKLSASSLSCSAAPPTMSSFANSYMAFLRARGSSMRHPSELRPFSLLADDRSPPVTYALTLAQCEDMTGMLALGSSGKVAIGHHFLFDMCTPFKPDSSNQFIMLTGRHTMDNAVMIDPTVGLAFPDNAPPIRYPSWAMLSATVDGPAICASHPYPH